MAPRKSWLIGWFIAYVGLMIGIVATMVWQRQKVLSDFSTPAAVAEWQAWRNDVAQEQANPGPVARRVPKSVEPPALVLMRDYFTVSLVGATFFTSILYWLIAWFVTGALLGDSRNNDLVQENP